MPVEETAAVFSVSFRTVDREWLRARAWLYRELGPGGRGTALSLAKLGEVTTAQGDYAVAHSCLEESLTISRTRGDKASMAFAMERLAGLAAAQCQPSRALRLAGIATALRQAIGTQIPAAARAQLEHRVQPARQALSAEVATAAWAEGEAMLLDEAVAYAVSSEVQDG